MNYKYGCYILRDGVYYVYDKPRKHYDGLLTCKLLLETPDKGKAINLLIELNLYFCEIRNESRYNTCTPCPFFIGKRCTKHKGN